MLPVAIHPLSNEHAMIPPPADFSKPKCSREANQVVEIDIC